MNNLIGNKVGFSMNQFLNSTVAIEKLASSEAFEVALNEAPDVPDEFD